jgi:phosphate-selective porin OprO/OprP
VLTKILGVAAIAAGFQLHAADARSGTAVGLLLLQDGAAQNEGTSKPSKQQTKKPEKADPAADDDIDSVEAPGGFVFRQRPSLRFKNVRIDFKARLQEDVHRSYEGADVSAGLSAFEARRNRIGIEGSLFKHIDFEVERELTEKDLTASEVAEGLTQKPPWKDVNVNVDYVKAVQVQAGRFKIPFGLDELTPITRNDFVYRSLGADYLAPGRDSGLMVHGRFFKRGLNYWLGAFRHDGDNARSKKIEGGNGTLAIRLTGAPFRRLTVARLDGLEVGTAYTVSALADDTFRPNGLRARTVMTEDPFFAAVYVKGQRHRWEGDVDWLLGRAAVRGEYNYVTDDRLGQGFDNQDLPDARYRSWHLSGTYIVTGEAKKRPLRPTHAFLQGGAGAVELAARYERLWCDSVGGGDIPFRNPRAETILPSGNRVLTIGVNWILNRWLALQVNGIREQVEDRERNPAPNGGSFWSRVLRFQLML